MPWEFTRVDERIRWYGLLVPTVDASESLALVIPACRRPGRWEGGMRGWAGTGRGTSVKLSGFEYVSEIRTGSRRVVRPTWVYFMT